MNDCARDGPLTREQLAALRLRLRSMSPADLASFYAAAREMCKLDRGRAPRAPFVQQLVESWREMGRRATTELELRKPNEPAL